MSLKQKFVSGIIWTLLERFSTQFVSFAVTMVLARLLTPSDYGAVALLTIFLTIAGALVDFGFGSALVQKKNAGDLEFNSVFYVSLMMGFVMYGILFFSAPFIASFYNMAELTPIVRVAASTIIFNAINSVQNAELSRKMLFGLSFRISMISSVCSASVGIVLAFLGYGPWALVWQSVASGVVGVLSRWFIIAWRPRLMFSWQALGGLFSFGWKISLDGMLNMAFDDVYGLVIGKFYSPADLAFVNKGKQLPFLVMGTVNGTIQRVAFPTLSQLQDDQKKIRDATRRMVMCSAFMIFPLMFGCAVCAQDIIVLLLGGQWEPAIPYAQLVCLQIAWWPLSLVQVVLMAVGRSGTMLNINMIRKVIGFVIMGATLWISPLVFMAAMTFIYAPLTTWTNTWPNKKIFNYTFMDEIRDVAKIALAAGLMSAIVYLIGLMFVWTQAGLTVPMRVLRLVIQISGGVLAYGVLSLCFRLDPLREYFRMAEPLIERRLPSFALRMNNLIYK